MRNTIVALTAASALVAATMTVPTKAEAHVWWWIPAAIVGGAVVGGAAIASSTAYAGPRGTVYVEPTRCRIGHDSRGRRVEVCD
jgi:hypothetical protein